ncbi:MAG: YlbF family regulator [Bacilli bacterium]|nr:YlbF family regulator [Bacilli bacterium]
MENSAKKINEEILNHPLVKEYLKLKIAIEKDVALQRKKQKLDAMRKELCKEKEGDSDQYYSLLEEYKKDWKISRFEYLNNEIKGLMVEISDILSLN